MKKFLTPLFLSCLLSACVTPSINIHPQQLAGLWGCETIYKDLNAATRDVVAIYPDKKVVMQGIIYDHHFNLLIDKKVENYFRTPFRYATTAEGAWQIKGDELIYVLTQQSVRRAIFPEVMERVQAYPKFKEIEQAIFNVYSEKNTNQKDKIELKVTKIDANHFTANQILPDNTYLSQCRRLTSQEKSIQFLLGIERK
ncbi:hypothetical protein [Avibacterium avium]|uniref:hypothetical protein n=1 Tax=Avibacterium avium TaxID=751 RepID=UPI003BF77A75